RTLACVSRHCGRRCGSPPRTLGLARGESAEWIRLAVGTRLGRVDVLEPLQLLLDAGIAVCRGTAAAMGGRVDLLAEVRSRGRSVRARDALHRDRALVPRSARVAAVAGTPAPCDVAVHLRGLPGELAPRRGSLPLLRCVDPA